MEPVDGSLLADLLWSDPSDDEAVVQTKMVADSPEDTVMPEVCVPLISTHILALVSGRGER